jgi:CBS domain containing-hemolysin-like protein
LKDDKLEIENDKNNGKMGINDEQANMMISALEIKEKKVISFMIPIRKVFMIDYDECLDMKKLKVILDNGYSRIPVFSNHNRNDIVGLLRIKQLIGLDFEQKKSLRNLGIELRKPIVISPSVRIVDLLREFRKGKSHMAFITEQVEDLQYKFGLDKTNSVKKDFVKELYCGNDIEMSEINVIGIITMEDIIEKMINLDILDEDDYDDKKILMNMKMKNKTPMKSRINNSINLFYFYFYFYFKKIISFFRKRFYYKGYC